MLVTRTATRFAGTAAMLVLLALNPSGRAEPASDASAGSLRVFDSVEVRADGQTGTVLGLIEVTTAHPTHPEASVSALWVAEARPTETPDWTGARMLMEVERLPIARRLGDPEAVRSGALALASSTDRLYVLDSALMNDVFLWQIREYQCKLDATGTATLTHLKTPFQHTGYANAERDGIVPSTISSISIEVQRNELILRLDAKEANSADAANRVERVIRIDRESRAESRGTTEPGAKPP